MNTISAILLAATVGLSTPSLAQQQDPVSVAQAQLDAYNKQDLDAFAATFAPDVQLFQNLGDSLPALVGRSALRERYGRLFRDYPANRSTLVGRMIQGNTVIDHERISGRGDKPVMLVAVYEIKNGLIARCWFIR